MIRVPVGTAQPLRTRSRKIGTRSTMWKTGTPLLCVLLLSLLCWAQVGNVEREGPLTDSSVPDAIRQALDSKGYRLVLENGTLLELWFRKSIPSQPKKDSADVIYTELPESTLVGVLHLSKPGGDFRGQQVPAGFYTLRYALIPNDGNHLGVSPNRDFLLLVPAESDSDPSAAFKFDQLVELSRKATGTRHPGPLSLVQPTGKEPKLSKNDQDQWIFSATIKLTTGEDLPFALVVNGTAQQ
jgi:hypothetical protein